MNLEKYLTHADFVRSLARSLVLDEHAAADLSQAAWLATLEHPPAADKPIRAWLTTVLRNFSVSFHRSESRRSRREQAVAREEAVPSSHEIVENMEIRRLLIDAVLSLAEPYRTTVFLRFYEGLTSREIARRLGLPLETVRTREKRSMEKLRKRLDGLHNGDRERWCQAFLPLVGLATAKISGFAKAAALVLVLGASLVIWSVVRGNYEGGYEEIAGNTAVEEWITQAPEISAPDDPEREPVLPGSEADRIPLAYAQALAGFHGRLLDSSRAPLARKTVELFSLSFSDLHQGLNAFLEDRARPFAFTRRLASTGVDGTFRFAGIGPDAYHLLAVDRLANGNLTRLVDVHPNPGETVDLGDLVLLPGISLAGKVTDQLGKPLAGIRVRAAPLPPAIFETGIQAFRAGCSILLSSDPLGEGPSVIDPPPALFQLLDMLPVPCAFTDEEGAFLLPSVYPGSLTLVADGLGYRSRWIRAGDPPEALIQLTSSQPLQGKVVDHRGEPVSGAELRFGAVGNNPYFCILQPAVHTDAQGRFLCPGPASYPVQCAWRSDPRDPWRFTERLHQGGEALVLTLACRTDLQVSIRSRQGDPIPEARVFLRKQGLGSLLPGPDSGYRLEDLAPGSYELRVSAPGFAPTVRTVTLEGAFQTEEVILERSCEARFRVVEGPAEAPLEWATVFLTPAPEADPALPVYNPTRHMASLDRLNLDRLNRWFRDAGRSFRGRTDGRGRAAWNTLNPGRYRLTVKHPGFIDFQSHIELPASVETVVRMERGGCLQGRVLSAGSGRTPPFTLSLIPWTVRLKTGAVQVESPATLTFPSTLNQRFVLTDREGTFRADALPPGRWRVQVWPRFFTRTPRDYLERVEQKPLAEVRTQVLTQEATRLDILLANPDALPRGTVSGTILINGVPAGGAWARLDSGRIVVADEQGNYTLEGIPAGWCDLFVRIPSGSNEGPEIELNRRLQVTENARLLENFSFSTGTLQGVVISHPQEVPLAGVELLAFGACNAIEHPPSVPPRSGNRSNRKAVYDYRLSAPIEVRTTSDSQGRFRFSGLPAGRYTVQAQPNENGNASSLQQSLEIYPGPGAESIRLEIHPPVSVQGCVKRPEAHSQTAGALLRIFPGDEVPMDGGTTYNYSRGCFQIDHIRTVPVQPSTGIFRIEALPPGFYGAQLITEEKTFETGFFEVPPEGLSDLVLTPGVSAKPK